MFEPTAEVLDMHQTTVIHPRKVGQEDAITSVKKTMVDGTNTAMRTVQRKASGMMEPIVTKLVAHMEEELVKLKNVITVRNTWVFGIQSARKVTMLLDAVFVNKTTQKDGKTLECHVRNQNMIVAREKHTNVNQVNT